MSEIDRIQSGAVTHKSIKREGKEPQTTQKTTEDQDSSIANTKPETGSIEEAESLLKELTSKIDSRTFEAQTARLDEDRIKALLEDD